jgi:hypothetical protein
MSDGSTKGIVNVDVPRYVLQRQYSGFLTNQKLEEGRQAPTSLYKNPDLYVFREGIFQCPENSRRDLHG